MQCLLGIDIGTYGSKGVLVDCRGRIAASRSLSHDLSVPRPGWAEHDAERVWWREFVQLARELVREAGIPASEIVGVAASAIGPCVLPVDAGGAPLRPAILYGIDTRATSEAAELTDALGPDWVVRHCGSPLGSQAAGSKVLWFRRHEPELWGRTARIHTATSFLVHRLTGRAVIDHYTAAAYGPLYDLRDRAWAPRPSTSSATRRCCRTWTGARGPRAG